jgi:hypothetical protein
MLSWKACCLRLAVESCSNTEIAPYDCHAISDLLTIHCICMFLFTILDWWSSVSIIVSYYGLDDRVTRVQSPAEAADFSCNLSRLALGPTQPPIQWVPGVLSLGVKCDRGVTLITLPHLVPRLRMSRSCTYSPPSSSMACSGIALLYFTFLFYLTSENYLLSYIHSWMTDCFEVTVTWDFISVVAGSL